jgi:hypothetical protein
LLTHSKGCIIKTNAAFHTSNMKKIFFIIAILFCSAVSGQPVSKKDTTVVLKTDEYNNSKPGRHDYPYSKTIALDSIENSHLAAQQKTVLVPFNYIELTAKADTLFKNGAYAAAANLYTTAFKKNNDRGQVKHRYNTARCFAKLQQNDSAFFHLYRIAEKGNYYNYIEIESEKYFTLLHADAKWLALIKIIKRNAEKMTEKVNAEGINKD